MTTLYNRVFNLKIGKRKVVKAIRIACYVDSEAAIKNALQKHGELLIVPDLGVDKGEYGVLLKCAKCPDSEIAIHYHNPWWLKDYNDDFSVRSRVVPEGLLLTYKRSKPRIHRVQLSSWELKPEFTMAEEATLSAESKHDLTNPSAEVNDKIYLTYFVYSNRSIRRYTRLIVTIENGQFCRDGKPLNLINNDEVIRGLYSGASK